MKTHEVLLGHPSDELLELYWFRRLTEFQLDEMEEHLLVCPPCQDRMADTDSYVHAMKQAFRDAVKHSSFPQNHFQSYLFTFVPKTLLASLFAVAFIAATLSLFNRSHPGAGAETGLTLVASRGDDSRVVSARVTGPLNLTMDLADMTPLPSYRVQIVSGNGKTIWESAATFRSRQLYVRIARRLEPGIYWVRVSGPNAEPVREFGLELK